MMTREKGAQQQHQEQQHQPTKRILVLHGSRQTGDLLLGRMDKLRKRLEKLNYELVAPSAVFAHPENPELRYWWNHVEGTDTYDGLIEQTLPQLQQLWKTTSNCVGLLGFSQGARLAHLLTLLHDRQPSLYLPGLQFTIMVANYEAPLPDGLDAVCPGLSSLSQPQSPKIQTPSLHVWGMSDALISPAQSKAVLAYYESAVPHIHESGHHVPMRAAHVRAYVDFITQTAAEVPPIASDSEARKGVAKSPAQVSPVALEPDEETKQTQQDELEALSAIFPDEFRLLSAVSDGGDVYQFPICYQLHLDQTDEGMWPPHPLRLEVTYPSTYPQSSPPHIRLAHDNNVLEFSAAQREACLRSMQEAALLEEGMPCVYSCYAAAKEFFESGVMGRVVASLLSDNAADAGTEHTATYSQEVEDEMSTLSLSSVLIRKSSKERIQQCNQQGLNIAASLLEELGMVKVAHQADAEEPATIARLKGGLWLYTIGLVGKPSAGKSTFFNAATAFARQRDDADNLLGGATMAPRPFTTIDPNVGFCLVPAPTGLCPEDDYQGQMTIGSTHGRDHLGRRLLPVLLKDVAGLVPGAYQGRGRGNKFLNDLTDADVLVHVLDASGMADVEGYDLGVEEDGRPNGAASHPLNDMEWIRTELIEWVHANLMHKWDSVKRKGRSKLMGMFSGYGQSQGLLWSVLDAVEKYLEKQEGRDHALDRMDEWDEGDLRRLVSTFLGVRFPMALALNKIDLPTSPEHIRDIQTALPVHGAYTGIPLSARSEMIFIRRRIEHALAGKVGQVGSDPKERLPEGVWSCLKSALSLYEPVLVFPVIDFTDYAPLPGLNRYATSDPSLPSVGMVTCLEAAGGRAPSLWDPLSQQYHFKKAVNQCLRDVLIMKPGSTVDDVFLALKNRKALEGDLIRAEAASEIGSPSRPVPKHQIIDRSHRILKIMTTKKASWQQNHR